VRLLIDVNFQPTGMSGRGSTDSSIPYGDDGNDIVQRPVARWRPACRHVVGDGEEAMFIPLDHTGLRRLCSTRSATPVARHS